jgi:methylenetetrahydrofolate dehydrogenase (NADP+)/methenyltetrahydrofolate cyclohydrolase
MTATLMLGKPVADRIRAQVADDVRGLGHVGLVTVLVGDDPASEIYIRLKHQAALDAGIDATDLRLRADISEAELLARIAALNADDAVDAMLVQLPLPDHIDEAKVISAVAPAKDVDGFHPVNAGKLQAGRPALAPCTPAGIIEILKRSQLPISGQHAVVVGRSDIVGKPVAMLLLHENATVTICHSKTRDLAAITREADILVAAIGRPGFITPDMVKPGATIIDVGINRITTLEEFDRYFAGDAKRQLTFETRGSTIVGDVHPKAFELAGAYTPVPGGVGPLTIAMLMSNTVRAAKMRRGL